MDGTGAPAYRADVGVRRGRIAAIGDLAGAPAGQRLDGPGGGRPGLHRHAQPLRPSLLLCPTGDSKIFQG